MAILSGDIKLYASQVMDDVAEGGGAPTSSVILDGASNQVFPDISEFDRAAGRVSLRKLFIGVGTENTDTYLGSNVIVAEPPTDPNVSVTLFTTGDTFDRRDAARTRIESFLNQGPEWSGFLYENHIAGQRSIQIFQRPTTEMPPVGRTLTLIFNEGLPNTVIQYVRITRTSSVIRLFYDEASGKDYEAQIVTAEISDALRSDFAGTPATRTFTRRTAGTRLRDTLVADAATYAGVVPLVAPARIGDVTALAQSVYTQLVPSAQTEIPLTDLKPNGEQAIFSAAGIPFNFSTSIAFSATNSIAVGQGILPGSLRINTGSVTVEDSGGALVVGTQQIGVVDYGQGVIRITDLNVGYPGTKSVSYTPAASPVRALNTASWAVTAEARSATYVTIIDPPPAPGTTSLSYMAQGRWYTLLDTGNGQLKSSNGYYGAGTINFITGSMVVTLAALPDVGSKVLATYGLPTTEKRRSGIAIKVQTRIQLTHGAVAPGTVSISWVSNSVPQSSTDNGRGLLQGDATGAIDYITGLVILKPAWLPTSAAEFTIQYSWGDPFVENFVSPERMPDGSLLIPLSHPNVMPRTVKVEWNTLYDLADLAFSKTITTKFVASIRVDPIVTVLDNGTGAFSTRPETSAVINYAAGTVQFKPETFIALPSTTWKQVSIGTRVVGSNIFEDFKNVFAGYTYSQIGARFPDDPTAYVKVSYRTTAAGSAATETHLFRPEADLTDGFREPIVDGSCTVTIAGRRYLDRQGSLVSAVDYATGAATTSGSLNYSSGLAKFTVLNEGAANAGTVDGLTTLQGPMPVMAVEFRTSAAPLRPSSFIVQFVVADDFNQTVRTVSADAQGVIKNAVVDGSIDMQTGVVTLRFGAWVTAAGNEAQPWFDASKVQDGKIFLAKAVLADTIRYAAVAYSYLPLDAALLRLDPVRLPQDGRVPIFRNGGFVVLGNTKKIVSTVSNGQVIDCARVRLSRVRITGATGVPINTGYTANLESGLVTIVSTAGWAQPVTIEHRIEDMLRLSDVQINGQLAFTRPITHEYPISGSYLSTALISDDLKSRVSTFFDQATWDGVTFTGDPVGNVAPATYNTVAAPLVVTNRGAVSERWALHFTSSSTFNIIGEHVGVIGIGSINTLTAPINPATGTPYFSMPTLGWGVGWSVGNVVRIDTVGTTYPLWVVRTVRQGAESVQDDSFTLLVRGDVNRP